MSNELPHHGMLQELISQREGNELHNVWFASTFSLSRNFSNFKFKERLSKEQRLSINELVLNTCRNNGDLLRNPGLFNAQDLNPWQKEILLEHFLFNQNRILQNVDDVGFIKDDSSLFCIALNLHDHLIFHAVDFKQDLENTWSHLNRIDAKFYEQVGFAFSEDFGFLTTNPKNCGTGLTLGTFLHVPLLFEFKKLPELIEDKNELSYMNFDGELGDPIKDPNHFFANILMISNSCSLGLTEENIISSLRIWCMKAMFMELGLRKTVAAEENKVLKDKVMRALGLITHSYQLELIEALNALSLIKLGLELHWLNSEDNPSIITQLFWNIRRAYLIFKSGETEAPALNDIPKIRSKYLREVCGKITVIE